MKKNGTVKMLVLSAVSVVLCLVMLLGATFAWFTSTAESAGNVITIAGFDIQLEWAQLVEKPDPNDNVFTDFAAVTYGSTIIPFFVDSDDSLIPGAHTKIVFLKVKNPNSYGIDANVSIVPTESCNYLNLYYKVIDSVQGFTFGSFDADDRHDYAEYEGNTVVLDAMNGETVDEVIVAIAFEFKDSVTDASQIGAENTFKIIIDGTQSHS